MPSQTQDRLANEYPQHRISFLKLKIAWPTSTLSIGFHKEVFNAISRLQIRLGANHRVHKVHKQCAVSTCAKSNNQSTHDKGFNYFQHRYKFRIAGGVA